MYEIPKTLEDTNLELSIEFSDMAETVYVPRGGEGIDPYAVGQARGRVDELYSSSSSPESLRTPEQQARDGIAKIGIILAMARKFEEDSHLGYYPEDYAKAA